MHIFYFLNIPQIYYLFLPVQYSGEPEAFGSQINFSGQETKVVAVGNWIEVVPMVKAEGI